MKFLVITLLVFFLIRYLLPVLLRLVLGNVVRKQMRNNGFNPPPPAGRGTAPGQVNVDYTPPPPAGKRPKGFQGGEYVDFEEVK